MAIATTSPTSDLALAPGTLMLSAREPATTRPLLAAIEERLWRDGRLAAPRTPPDAALPVLDVARRLELDPEQVIPFSAVSNEGRHDLAAAIVDLIAQPAWRRP